MEDDDGGYARVNEATEVYIQTMLALGSDGRRANTGVLDMHLLQSAAMLLTVALKHMEDVGHPTFAVEDGDFLDVVNMAFEYNKLPYRLQRIRTGNA